MDGEIKFQPCVEMLGWEILPVQEVSSGVEQGGC